MAKKKETVTEQEKEYVKDNIDESAEVLSKELDKPTSFIEKVKEAASNEIEKEQEVEKKAKLPAKKKRPPKKNKKVEEADSQNTGEKRPPEKSPEPDEAKAKTEDEEKSQSGNNPVNNNGSFILNVADSQLIDSTMKKKNKLSPRLQNAIHRLK